MLDWRVYTTQEVCDGTQGVRTEMNCDHVTHATASLVCEEIILCVIPRSRLVQYFPGKEAVASMTWDQVKAVNPGMFRPDDDDTVEVEKPTP